MLPHEYSISYSALIFCLFLIIDINLNLILDQKIMRLNYSKKKKKAIIRIIRITTVVTVFVTDSLYFI